jgi:hypothetical protein
VNDREARNGMPELAIKAATRELIAATGGTDGAGATCGARQQRMSDCQNRNTTEFLRIDEVGKLEDVAPDEGRWPHVTRSLALRQGFVLVRVRQEVPSTGDWHHAMAGLSKHASDVIQRICEALPQGASADDVRRLNIRNEIAEAQEQLALLDALAAQVEKEGQE